jgi:hypothetical protein
MSNDQRCYKVDLVDNFRLKGADHAGVVEDRVFVIHLS